MELEDNNFVFFLDILISRKVDGSLAHQLYHKKTHTKKYLHAYLHHHPSQKEGVINTLVSWALKILNEEHLGQEKKHLINRFKYRDYKEWQVKKEFQKDS